MGAKLCTNKPDLIRECKDGFKKDVFKLKSLQK
jgi:hypothetical protein